MKNIITIYELIGLIKDNKAPKKIKYNNVVFTFDEKTKIYANDKDNQNWNFLYERHGESIDFVNDFLKVKLEILPEENEIKEMASEFKNISLTDIVKENRYAINSLIKNQKHLKERLEEIK